MSLDLSLLIVDMGDFAGHPMGGTSNTMIRLGKDYDLWDAIRAVPSRAIALTDFYGYRASLPEGNVGFGPMTGDPYGNPLRWVRAADLLDAIGSYHRTQTPNPWNLAAYCYLAAVHPDTPIVLFWH